MPPNYEGLRSPIPVGLITYTGSDAIAAKDAADQSFYRLTVTFPDGFAYLPRNLMTTFISDDLVNDFNLVGKAFYNGPGITAGLARNPELQWISSGESISSNATKAQKIWVPGAGAPKLLTQGGDTMGFDHADMTSDASTAGDFHYFQEFYVFNVDQVTRWEVNTPIPTISHTSF